MDKTPEIYTQEHIVFATGLRVADTSKPIKVYTDGAGHHVVSDGNHRSRKALMDGKLGELPREIIGHLVKDVSQDPNYRHIRKLEVLSETHERIS